MSTCEEFVSWVRGQGRYDDLMEWFDGYLSDLTGKMFPARPAFEIPPMVVLEDEWAMIGDEPVLVLQQQVYSGGGTRRNMLQHMPHEPGVYVIIDKPTGHLYIGQSGDMRQRCGAHFSMFRWFFGPDGKREQATMDEMLSKWRCGVLEIVPDMEERLARELAWIRRLRPYFNRAGLE